jgi:hypothetical protein
MWAQFVIVSTPSLAFSSRFVEAYEPVGIQAFDPELAVQGFDIGIVCRFAGPAEVERDTLQEDS